MKVTMLTLQAGPDGVRKPGESYDVPSAEAEALIAGGYAKKTEPVTEPVTKLEPVVEGKPRTATRGRGRTGTQPEPASAADLEGKDP
jgi:hypothetical protein